MGAAFVASIAGGGSDEGSHASQIESAHLAGAERRARTWRSVHTPHANPCRTCAQGIATPARPGRNRNAFLGPTDRPMHLRVRRPHDHAEALPGRRMPRVRLQDRRGDLQESVTTMT